MTWCWMAAHGCTSDSSQLPNQAAATPAACASMADVCGVPHHTAGAVVVESSAAWMHELPCMSAETRCRADTCAAAGRHAFSGQLLHALLTCMTSFLMGVAVRRSYSATPLSLPVVANTSASDCRHGQDDAQVNTAPSLYSRLQRTGHTHALHIPRICTAAKAGAAAAVSATSLHVNGCMVPHRVEPCRGHCVCSPAEGVDGL